MLDLMLLLENPIKIAAIERILSTAIRTGQIDAELSPSTIAILKDVANRLMNADPTQQKRSAEWLARLVIRGDIGVPGLTKPSDSPTVMVDNDADIKRLYDALEAFERAKPRLGPTQRDVNRYRTLQELETVITSAVGAGQVKATFAFARQVDGASVIYHRNDTTVYKIAGKDSSSGTRRPDPAAVYAVQTLGDGPPETKWCTRGSYKPSSMASNYLSQGTIYVVYKSGVPFAQFLSRSLEPADVTAKRQEITQIKTALQAIAQMVPPRSPRHPTSAQAIEDSLADEIINLIRWICSMSESDLAIRVHSILHSLHNLVYNLDSKSHERNNSRRSTRVAPGDINLAEYTRHVSFALARLKLIKAEDQVRPLKEEQPRVINWAMAFQQIMDINNQRYEPYWDWDTQAPNEHPECGAIYADINKRASQPLAPYTDEVKQILAPMIQGKVTADGITPLTYMQQVLNHLHTLLPIIDQRVLKDEKYIITSRGNIIVYSHGHIVNSGLDKRKKLEWLISMASSKSPHTYIELYQPYLIGSLNQELDARRSEYSRYNRLDNEGKPMSITIRLGYAMSPQIYTDETGTRRLRLVEFTG